MVLLHTPKKVEGFKAPDFSLMNIDESTYSLSDCMGKNGLVVMFICNHCPYVIAITDRLAQTCYKLKNEGVECVAIMANDTDGYPQDSFDNMKIFAAENHFNFPYLIDTTQETAKSYGAICTPDFFGFDKDGNLHYRGRLDSAANKPTDKNTVPELLNAMLELKEKANISTQQHPSMGCSIKWKKTLA